MEMYKMGESPLAEMRRAFFLYPALRYPYYKNTKEPLTFTPYYIYK